MVGAIRYNDGVDVTDSSRVSLPAMRRLPMWRRIAATIVLTCLMLYTGWLAWCTFSAAPLFEVSRSQGEFDALGKRLMPAIDWLVAQDIARIQLVGPTTQTGELNDAVFQIMLTQYFAAPVVIIADQPQPWILADFDDDDALNAYQQAHELTLVRHVAPGLAILQREAP